MNQITKQELYELKQQIKTDIQTIRNGMEVLKSAFEYKTFTDNLVQQILSETKSLSKILQTVQKTVNSEELDRLENILTRLEMLKTEDN